MNSEFSKLACHPGGRPGPIANMGTGLQACNPIGALSPPLLLISAQPKRTAFSLPHGKIREKIRFVRKMFEIHRKYIHVIKCLSPLSRCG
jgi:hypothetical protein